MDEFAKIRLRSFDPIKKSKKTGANEKSNGKNRKRTLNPPNIKKIRIPR
jgi:hypothetical protein